MTVVVEKVYGKVSFSMFYWLSLDHANSLHEKRSLASASEFDEVE
jgi:hypothetical protein